MARNKIRIRPFEARSHFLSIANPPRPQIPMKFSQKSTFPQIQKIKKSFLFASITLVCPVKADMPAACPKHSAVEFEGCKLRDSFKWAPPVAADPADSRILGFFDFGGFGPEIIDFAKEFNKETAPCQN